MEIMGKVINGPWWNHDKIYLVPRISWGGVGWKGKRWPRWVAVRWLGFYGSYYI